MGYHADDDLADPADDADEGDMGEGADGREEGVFVDDYDIKWEGTVYHMVEKYRDTDFPEELELAMLLRDIAQHFEPE